jgi:SAM-dependent methyltransferase
VTYADALQSRFPGLDPQVDDLFLLEAHQIASLPTRAPSRDLAAVLHAYPRVRRFFVARHPPIEGYLAQLLAEHGPAVVEELLDREAALLWEIADWIVYQRAPQLYGDMSDLDPGLTAISDVVSLDGKVVIDAGAGTGRMAFAAAGTARHVFAVEPVATLRRYMRERAARLGIGNLFVVDGFLDAIPLPAATADVLLTRQAIGWRLAEELLEIERVVKPDGTAVHLVGMPHPAPPDDDLHTQLVADGYRPGTYRAGSTVKRKYWKRFETEPGVQVHDQIRPAPTAPPTKPPDQAD